MHVVNIKDEYVKKLEQENKKLLKDVQRYRAMAALFGSTIKEMAKRRNDNDENSFNLQRN